MSILLGMNITGVDHTQPGPLITEHLDRVLECYLRYVTLNKINVWQHLTLTIHALIDHKNNNIIILIIIIPNEARSLLRLKSRFVWLLDVSFACV